jgi:hypothetical protein
MHIGIYALIYVFSAQMFRLLKTNRRVLKPQPVKPVRRSFTSDAIVHTMQGLTPVRQLIGRPFVANVNGLLYKSTKGFWPATQQLFYKVELQNGMSIDLPKSYALQTILQRESATKWLPHDALHHGLFVQIAKTDTVCDFESLKLVLRGLGNTPLKLL